MLKACDACALRRHGPVIAHCTDSEDFLFCGGLTCNELTARWVACLPWSELQHFGFAFEITISCLQTWSDLVRCGLMWSDAVIYIRHTLDCKSAKMRKQRLSLKVLPTHRPCHRPYLLPIHPLLTNDPVPHPPNAHQLLTQ